MTTWGQKKPFAEFTKGALEQEIRRYLLSHFWHYHRLRKLNYRVRDGNGCDLSDLVAGRSAWDLLRAQHALSWSTCKSGDLTAAWSEVETSDRERWIYVAKHTSISTGQLNTLLCLHIRPIDLVVFHGTLALYVPRNLILERASRLDAFSVYPFRP